MKNARHRSAVVLLATLVVLASPFIAAAVYVVEKHAWGEARLAELEPRHARLLGLETQKTDLDAALTKAQSLRSQYVYPSEQDAAQAGNAAQQRVRDIFGSAGLQISSSQVLPAKTDKGFDRVPLSVRTEGNLLSLQTALAGLADQKPVIVIDEFEVQVIGGSVAANPPRLAISFNLSVLRAGAKP